MERVGDEKNTTKNEGDGGGFIVRAWLAVSQYSVVVNARVLFPCSFAFPPSFLATRTYGTGHLFLRALHARLGYRENARRVRMFR